MYDSPACVLSVEVSVRVQVRVSVYAFVSVQVKGKKHKFARPRVVTEIIGHDLEAGQSVTDSTNVCEFYFIHY